MLRQEHVNTLRQTHRAVTTLLPVVTAALTVTGALIATMEQGKEQGKRQARQEEASFAQGAARTSRADYANSAEDETVAGEGKLTVGAYLQTLIGHVLLIVLGIALVLALGMIAMRSGPVGVAIELTALVLLALYLTERVARNARRHARANRRHASQAQRAYQASQQRPAADASQPQANTGSVPQAA